MESLKKLCLEEGFTNVEFIKTEVIRFEPSLRGACEQNYCGTYGTNWVCPPAIPPIEEMEGRVKAYEGGLVVQLVGQLEDSFDFEGMEEIGKNFKKQLYSLVDKFKANDTIKDVFALGVGGCSLCAKCTYPENKPCRFPDKALYSVEACGIVVNSMIEKVGLKYNNGENTVSYCGLILFR